MQSVADASSLAVAKELHVYRDDLAELRGVGKARVEALLTEVGIAGRPHDAAIGINPADNLIDVDLSHGGESAPPGRAMEREPDSASRHGPALMANRVSASSACTVPRATRSRPTTAQALTAPDCAVQSNSTDPDGLHVSGGSEIDLHAHLLVRRR